MGCFVRFTGLSHAHRGVYTATLGFRPGVAVVTMAPQALSTSVGTLVLSDGTTSLTLTNCLLDQTTARVTTNGHDQTVLIYDRRWLWQYTACRGQWNGRLNDGTLDPVTQKSARELVTRLLQGMGETSADVSLVPNDDYPEVDWDGEKAWVCCQRLLARYNMDIALNPGTDTVYVVQLGSGSSLPTGYEQSVAASADFNPWPDSIAIYSGRAIAESLFELEAVGVDTDGSIVPIDELSFAPSGGWAGNVSDPLDLIPSTTDKVAYGLANRYVGRTFRISDVSPPDGANISSHEQCLPLRENRLASYEDLGDQFPAPALLMGVFCQMEGTPASLSNAPAWTEYEGGFRIDKMRGIVRTTDPVWKLDGTGLAAPNLYLQTSHYLIDDEKQFQGYYLQANLAANGVPQEQRVRNEYQLTLQGVYVDGALSSTISNESDLYSILNGELMLWAAGYATAVGKTVTYGVLKAVHLSGVVRAIRWEIDQETGATTVASENSEYIAGVKPRIMRLRDGESEPGKGTNNRRRRRQRGRE